MRIRYSFLVLVFIGIACNNSDEKQEGVKQNEMENLEDAAANNAATFKDPSLDTKTNYFIANGTEPFWNLQIKENIIVFKTPSDSIKMPHVEPILAQDSNVKRYAIETESTKMTVQISQGDCTNAMSGKISPYTVTIDYNKGAEKEFQKLEGCGYYVTDYRLHDIWVLE